MSLCRDRYTTNETVVERLTASGYEVETLDRYTAFPNCPKEPKAENFNDPERYGEARTRYEQQWADYMEQEEEITRRSGAGEITVYAKIGQKEIDILLRGERDRDRDSGRNARTRTALTRGEIGEAGRAQQGNRTRTHGGGHQETDSRSRHHGRQSSVQTKTRCCTSSFCPRSGRNTSQPWGLRKTSRISRTRTRWGLSETSP